jgi:hypothetical protein
LAKFYAQDGITVMEKSNTGTDGLYCKFQRENESDNDQIFPLDAKYTLIMVGGPEGSGESIYSTTKETPMLLTSGIFLTLALPIGYHSQRPIAKSQETVSIVRNREDLGGASISKGAKMAHGTLLWWAWLRYEHIESPQVA